MLRCWWAMLGIGLSLMLANWAVASQQKMAALTPGDNELPGWAKLNADAWGDDREAFFDILDGGAEVYTDAGGSEIFYRAYKKDKKILQVTVIDMSGDWQKAKKFFTQRQTGFAKKAGYKQLKIEKNGFYCTQSTSASGLLWNAQYYCEFSINSSQAEYVAALQKLMRTVSAKITRKK